MPLIKAMTAELLVSSLRRAFISSGDMVGGATEGVVEAALLTVEMDFEYLEMVFDSSGALAPSTRSTTLPS